MKIKLLALLFSLVAVCPARADDVKDFFEAAMAKKSPYKLIGVTGYDVRAFEVVHRTKDLVSVRITYAAKNGADFISTKKFLRDGNGRMVATDRDDIRREIRKNLMWISSAADIALLGEGKEVIGKLTLSFLVEKKYYKTDNLTPVEGEDYTKVRFELKKDFAVVSLDDAEGIPVVFDPN